MQRLNTGSAFNIPVEGQPLIVGNILIFGCKCSGWKEGAVGTLSYRSKKESDSLQQEFTTSSLFSVAYFVVSGFKRSQVQEGIFSAIFLV